MKCVITGHDEQGRSVFVSEEPPVRVVEPVPGYKLFEIFATDTVPVVGNSEEDPTITMTSLTPSPGGSRFRIFTIPPGAGMDEADPVAREEMKRLIEQNIYQIPGLGEHLEIDDPGMHATDTVDYVVVISGEADLELDDGAKVHVARGDCVVQRGTRHAWRNPGTDLFVAAAVMIGAERIP